MAMDYIEKLNNGQPISKVFTSSRKTQYRDLYIVSVRKKEALLHCSEEKKTFLSEWFDHIDDFNNFIYTKVYLGEKYNYIYPNGKLVSPYWSDEMNKMGQALWPISFNGKFNCIKEDGSLLLQDFADGLWIDEEGDNSFIIRMLSTNRYSQEYTYYRLKNDGEIQFIGRNTKYDRKPVVDVYSSKSSLSDRLILHRRLFSLSVEDSYGKGLVSDVLEVIKHNVRPVTDLEGISEGNQGSLFSIKKEKLAENEELLLFYDFATIRCANGYRVLCFSTDSLIPDIFEEVQVLRALYIKVRKDGVWNIIDKYGDYVSKELWFDNIELMSNGNAIVKKGEQNNFLKSNGLLLSSEWYDEITLAAETGKYVVRRGDVYNVIDSNLRFINRKWQDMTEVPPASPKKTNTFIDPIHKSWSTIQEYDPVWIDCNGVIVECFVLSHTETKITILWPVEDKGNVEVKVVETLAANDAESISTPMGHLYFNKPIRLTNIYKQ